MAKYGKEAQQEVKKEVTAFNKKHKWQNREQAIAVGLSKARKKGIKVPKPKE